VGVSRKVFKLVFGFVGTRGLGERIDAFEHRFDVAFGELVEGFYAPPNAFGLGPARGQFPEFIKRFARVKPVENLGDLGGRARTSDVVAQIKKVFGGKPRKNNTRRDAQKNVGMIELDYDKDAGRDNLYLTERGAQFFRRYRQLYPMLPD